MDLSYSPAYEIREPDTFSKENDLYNLCNYATEGMSGGPLRRQKHLQRCTRSSGNYNREKYNRFPRLCRQNQQLYDQYNKEL